MRFSGTFSLSLTLFPSHACHAHHISTTPILFSCSSPVLSCSSGTTCRAEPWLQLRVLLCVQLQPLQGAEESSPGWKARLTLSSAFTQMAERFQQ